MESQEHFNFLFALLAALVAWQGMAAIPAHALPTDPIDPPLPGNGPFALPVNGFEWSVRETTTCVPQRGALTLAQDCTIFTLGGAA